MATMEDVAKAIMDMTHTELVAMAGELVEMQKGAKEDGWEWKPCELHGEHGMISMLHAWAESKV